jgi:hypothetical protein
MTLTRRSPLAWVISNPARAVSLAIATGYALIAIWVVPLDWDFRDADAYWEAGERLRSGEPLYFSVPADPSDPTIYRYAPWFAWLWVPLTYLPYGLVMALWAALLVGAAIWLVWPNWGSPASVALSLLLLPYLLAITSTGNVQTLMLAGIAYGLTSRWGPVIVGMAASLKVWPLLYAAYWWRQPSRVALAVGVAALLILPALAYDLSAYPPTTGVLITLAIKNALLVFGRITSRGYPIMYEPPPLRGSRS